MNKPTMVVASHAVLPNGPAHRLVGSLREQGYPVGFCALPLPGGPRWRSERVIPGREPGLLIDEPRRVPARQEVMSMLELQRFAWQMARAGHREVVLVACDSLVFL